MAPNEAMATRGGIFGLTLLSAAAHAADWITLDLTGLFSLLACWALGLGAAVAALTFGVSAGMAKSRDERERQLKRTALCGALAAGFGLLLPALLGGLDKGSSSTVDALAIFWAPGSAALAVFALRQIGRKP